MKILSTAIIMFGVCVFCFGCAGSIEEQEAARFIDGHLKVVRPLVIEAGLANWKAANSGKAEDYGKISELHLKIRQIYSNPEEYAFVKRLKESGGVQDRLLSRQVDGLYSGYLSNQIEPELLKELAKKAEGDDAIKFDSRYERWTYDSKLTELLKVKEGEGDGEHWPVSGGAVLLRVKAFCSPALGIISPGTCHLQID